MGYSRLDIDEGDIWHFSLVSRELNLEFGFFEAEIASRRELGFEEDTISRIIAGEVVEGDRDAVSGFGVIEIEKGKRDAIDEMSTHCSVRVLRCDV